MTRFCGCCKIQILHSDKVCYYTCKHCRVFEIFCDFCKRNVPKKIMWHVYRECDCISRLTRWHKNYFLAKKKMDSEEVVISRRKFIEFDEIYPMLKKCHVTYLKVIWVREDYFHVNEDVIYINAVNLCYNSNVHRSKYVHY